MDNQHRTNPERIKAAGFKWVDDPTGLRNFGNTNDPTAPNARSHHQLSYHEWGDAKAAQASWERHIQGLRARVLGPPVICAGYPTQEVGMAQGAVGIYGGPKPTRLKRKERAVVRQFFRDCLNECHNPKYRAQHKGLWKENQRAILDDGIEANIKFVKLGKVDEIPVKRILDHTKWVPSQHHSWCKCGTCWRLQVRLCNTVEPCDNAPNCKHRQATGMKPK